jgi:hypothetical protein
MSRKLDRGVCENCRKEFSYFLVHNGFSDTVFAYCDSCPCTTLLSRWYERIPKTAQLQAQGPIAEELEQLLRRCGCGGKRSRHCQRLAVGWSMVGYYSIVIENRMVTDNWRDDVA